MFNEPQGSGSQQLHKTMTLYRYALHNNVSVNDGPHVEGGLIRLQHYNIILQYNTYHCVTIAYSIQYSNILYRFVAQEQ
jgi:hypothetical protein